MRLLKVLEMSIHEKKQALSDRSKQNQRLEISKGL